MATQARARELLMQFLFTVHDSSNQLQTSKFQECTGLKKTVNVAQYREGGAFAAAKEPGLVDFGDVTLTRGVNELESFWNWCQEVSDILSYAPEGAGVLTLSLLRDMIIRQRDRTQTGRIDFPMAGCFPSDFEPGTWNNMSNDVQIEKLTLAIHYFDRKLI